MVGFFFLIISITGEARLHESKQVTGSLNTKTYHPAQCIRKYYTLISSHHAGQLIFIHHFNILSSFTEDTNIPTGHTMKFSIFP